MDYLLDGGENWQCNHKPHALHSVSIWEWSALYSASILKWRWTQQAWSRVSSKLCVWDWFQVGCQVRHHELSSKHMCSGIISSFLSWSAMGHFTWQSLPSHSINGNSFDGPIYRQQGYSDLNHSSHCSLAVCRCDRVQLIQLTHCTLSDT